MECEDCEKEGAEEYICPYTEALSEDNDEVEVMLCGPCYINREESI